jgi:activator of 2-hydroxyglutaryl-CoA dehydratase
LLQEVLGVPLNVSAQAQFMGAIGAGLYALDQVRAGRRSPHAEEANR